MERTHVAHPLIAFDQKERPIVPGDYERRLPGAEAYVEFRLHHVPTDSLLGEFRAYVNRIRLLNYPVSRVVDPEDHD